MLKYNLIYFSGGDYRSKTFKNHSKENDSINNENEENELDTNNNEQLTVNIEETDLLRSTISDLLRSLLTDRVFADTLPEMITESIPLFSQLKFTPSSTNNNEELQDSRSSKDYQIRANLDEVVAGESDQSLLWSSGDQENNLNRTKPTHSTGQYPKRITSTSSTLSDFEQKQTIKENEHVTNNPNITSLMEDIIENTVWNILQEAYHNEFSLTARPRLIALPPKRQSPLLTRVNLQQTDFNQSNFPPPPLIMTESFD